MKKRFFITCFLLLFAFSSTVVYGANSKIPILMYHDITPAAQSDNPWAVTQQSFYDDMVYLKQNNYTTLLPAEVIAIKNGQLAMPKKPIMVTFDDGYASNYQYALPTLDALNMKATVAVITKLIRFSQEEGNPNYMTWSQITAMDESGHFNIASHTHNLHNSQEAGGYNACGVNGVGRLAGENEATYLKRTAEDLQASVNLIKTYTKSAPIYFAYPYGKTDSWFTKNLVDNGIPMSTTVAFKVADIQSGLTQLPRLTVTPQESASFVLSGKNTKAKLPAKVLSKELTINQKIHTFSAFLIADYAYISVSDLQKQCQDSSNQFSIVSNAQQGLRIVRDHLKEETTVVPSTVVKATVKYCDRAIESPPQLMAVGTKYAVVFPIDGEYFIRLQDVKELIIDKAVPPMV